MPARISPCSSSFSSVGASLALNELAETRAGLLGHLSPDVGVTRFDAARIDDHLDASVIPTVVVMNPPFSALANVDRRRTGTALRHVSSALARGVSSLFGEYVYLVDVKEDNSRLSYENARLRSRVRELEHAEAESHRLRRLLGMRDTIADETVSAVVVGKDTTEYFRVAHVTLDSPHANVRPNMPVISLDGAVGMVQRVAGEKIDVQLTIDSGFGVDVVVERTGARGFMRGEGDRSRYMVRVEWAERRDEVRQLRGEVERLPDAYRETLTLFYYDDLSYRDIADALDVSPATVNARLTKARALLRSRMNRPGNARCMSGDRTVEGAPMPIETRSPAAEDLRGL